MDFSTSSADAEKGVLSSPLVINAPSTIRTVQRRIVRVLLPSFLSQNERSGREKPRTTDFLDGMRGYAAFFVYLCHFIMPTHPKAHMGYGGNGGVDDYWVTQLPIIRLLYSGHVCVCLFFVISGFSVSLKPLQQARKGTYSSLFDTMVSATFRRPCRLYVPCLAMLVITFLLACCGAFDFSYALTKKWPFPSKPLRIPMVHKTLFLQTKDFAGQVWDWADPLNKKTKHIPYGVQLWTIPVELRCSFISFLAIIGLAKVRSPVRIGVVAAIAVYFQLQRHPEATLFLAGTILAELHLIHEERAAVTSSRITESQAQKLRATLLFIFGLFLASYPPHGAAKALFWSPFRWIGSLIVGETEDALTYLYTTIASTLLVYVADRSPFLQDMFTTPVAKYLGKVSFAFYCVHQAMINWFGYRSILFFWTFTGRQTLFQYEFGIGIAWVFQTVVTFWAADLFWRFVDAPCVRFTKWVESVCVISSS
jgi:peptidoglycan/LPS O-acetylase OafA/YrhL